ncbi:MAG: glycosyl transferase WecB/TagA/CpsF family protein, N-acetylglucosaminyldiphosphoundecaprenol [Candidatus Dadabacteria bacterium CSP1-2]|nr:MAG: glycosyl transferase WecB/TagA/CpsF family protein, N-acetylglucosaminyldiphosphoundecaprenol [Candidatus Dadabacteria bacterium CSP1-2]
MNQSSSPIIVHPLPFFKVLGVRVDAVQIPDVICQMEQWINEKSFGHFIAVTNTHVVTEARREPSFKQVLGSADLVVPDGMPLVWLGRLSGYSLKRRVYGPELMETFLKETGPKYRHFLYGGAPGVPERLFGIFSKRFQGIRFVGVHSPPFRPLTPKEDEEVVELINKAEPDVLWVGLGAPKQERWIYEHKERLRVPIMVGVGAAFDFLAGVKSQAPHWMKEHGLEWLWRLMSEPRRLWRRYLIYGSLFISLVILEKMRILRVDWK